MIPHSTPLSWHCIDLSEACSNGVLLKYTKPKSCYRWLRKLPRGGSCQSFSKLRGVCQSSAGLADWQILQGLVSMSYLPGYLCSSLSGSPYGMFSLRSLPLRSAHMHMRILGDLGLSFCYQEKWQFTQINQSTSYDLAAWLYKGIVRDNDYQEC